MADQDLEDRLARRGRRLDERPVLSSDAEARVRRELAAEAALAARRAWFVRVAVAAAAALVLAWLALRPEPAGVDPPRVELALLDGDGRPLDARTRSVGGVLEPPERVVVETLGGAGLHVRLVLFGPAGEPRIHESSRIPESGEWLVAFPPEAYPLRAEGPSLLSVVALASVDPLPDSELRELLPRSLSGDPAARDAELERLAERLEQRLPVRALFRTVTVAVR